MAITFNNNFKIGIGAPIDSKYLNSLNQPYASTGATNLAIVESQRYVGLTVNIGNVEYWYKNGVADTDLILKTVSTTGGTGTITGGTNGLSVFGKNIGLGGTIGSGNTAIINDARFTPIGIVYGGDYSNTFIGESLITRRYVDERTTGTTFHIPVFNGAGNNLIDSTLLFSATTLQNSTDLTIRVPNTNSIYVVAPSNANQYNTLTLGKPTLGTGTTNNFICVAGQATDINLTLTSKGTGNTSYIMFNTPATFLGSNGENGLSYLCALRILRLPKSGNICGYGGTSSAGQCDATPIYIIGGAGYGNGGFSGAGGNVNICGGDGQGTAFKLGGDVIIEGGISSTGTTRGNIKFCNLPAKTGETNVVYYNPSTGKLSHGLASGGTGNLITGGTNGLSVSGMNIKLGGTLCEPTTIGIGGTNTAGLEYFTDYGSCFTDRSLIDKGYVDRKNEKVSKIVTQIGHTFVVGNVVGLSGGTYNKPIADGTYNGEILGLITKISGNTFELSQAGYATGFTGLSGNTTYFLSDVTAGLMTATEPIILGHINKAVLIADASTSGWILPYAGYVISSGLTGGSFNNGERIVKSITQIAHGFVLNDIIGWSGGTYNKAISDGTYNGEVIGIITHVTGNTFELTQAGYFSGFTALNPNTTYFLSDTTAGLLSTVKPTIPTHVVRSVLVTTTSDAGWVLPYAGYILTSGNTSGSALTGATNGLHVVGNDALFGGILTICTVLNGACFDIQGVEGMNIRTTGSTDINIDAQSCGSFAIKSQCGTCSTFTDFTNAVGILGNVHVTNGFTIYDNRLTTGQTGIVYGGNYSSNYINRSLVDKQYVDTIATGLNVHTAVKVATTSGITIATAPAVIDGITLVNGDRVLVKNQGINVTGHTDNGIYDFNGAGNPLTRSVDYDGSPVSEVSNGDLIPVTTGLTQNNSLWALTSLNPITVGVTPLIFSQFSTIVNINGGQGIAISQIGGAQTICVDLSSNCGLMFCGSQLAVNNTIGGIGLTYTNGVLDVNIVSGGTALSIPVRYNAGECLVLNCTDINGTVGALNGLHKNSGGAIVLGGTLTGDTCIDVCLHQFCVVGAPAAPFIAINDTTQAISTICMGGRGCTTICSGGAGDGGINLTSQCNLNMDFTGAAIITDNNFTPSGLTYAADYSTSFMPFSLVSKNYVDNAFSISGATATNGLNKNIGGAIGLGGTLTGNTFINIDSGNLFITGGTDFGITASPTLVTFGNYDFINASGLSYVTIDPNAISLNVQTVDGCCNGYAFVNSAYAYMSQSINGVTGNVCANNGNVCLNSIDNNTGCNFCINVNPNSVIINSVNNGDHCLTINTGMTCILQNDGSSNFAGIYLTTTGSCIHQTSAGNYSSICMDNGNICMNSQHVSACDTMLILSGDTMSICGSGVFGGAKYCADYSANFTARSLPDAAWVTGNTRNNVYSISAITSSPVTLTTGSSYLIVVNYPLPVTIFLPTTLLDGQAFKIKDGSGSALLNNITIDGGGIPIDDLVTSTAIIDTDWGALEIVYAAVVNRWLITAFKN